MEERIKKILDDAYDLGRTDSILKESSNDYPVLMPKIRAALLEAHRAEMSALLERVNREVIGEDIVEDYKDQPERVDWLYDYEVCRRNGENRLRIKQRTALAAIKAEYQKERK